MTTINTNTNPYPSAASILRLLVLIGAIFVSFSNAVVARSGGDSIHYVDSYLWGAPRDVHIDDTLAYVTFAHGLAVFDISDATDPVRLGHIGLAGGGFGGYPVDGYLLVTYAEPIESAGGMHVVDVSDPMTPTLVSSSLFPYRPEEVAVVDSLAFLAFKDDSGQSGLRVFSIADPAAPIEIGSVVTSTKPYRIAVDGDHAYLSGEGVAVINIQSPSSPSVVTEYSPTYVAQRSNVVPRDTILFVSVSTSAQPALSRLDILNIANPESPIELGSVEFAGLIPDMHLEADTLFLSNEDRVYALDVSDLTSPDTIATHVTWGWATSLDYCDGLMVAGDWGGGPRYVLGSIVAYYDRDLLFLDWTEIQAPSQIGAARLYSPVVEITASGDYAYAVLAADTGANLVVVDISGGSQSPVAAKYTVPGEPNNVFMSDSLLLITGEYGLEVVNVANPAQPSRVRGYPLEPFRPDNTYAAVAYGHYVFLAAYTRGYLVFDLDDPTDLPVATIPSGAAFDVAMSGNYLYTNDGRVFDISEPNSPAIVGTYDSGNEVCVEEDLLCVGTSVGFKLFDLSVDPTKPTLFSTQSGLSIKQDIHLARHHLFVAIGWDGILKYDLSDPANPLLDAAYDTPGSAHGVFSQDTLVLVADYYGLVTLRTDVATDVTDPELPTLPTSFVLSEVYPNPFNPQAKVNLSLPSKQTVYLTVYNILGQAVQSIVTTLPAGRHTINLDLSDSPTGVYFVRALSNEFDQTKKMILMK